MKRRSAAAAITAAWVLSLGFDLLLHGGLLARVYARQEPFLLPADEAFARIPLGYLAFLGLTVALYWLLSRLGVRGAMAGFRFGILSGAVVWGALALGLYSISTASATLLGGWWAGQALELGLAGAVLGAWAAGVRPRRIWSIVAMAVVTCIILTIALQSLGFAPAMRIAN